MGLKDDVDFQQIPWRNGRFDPGVLEQRVENSDRMARLWTAWRMHPGTRTIVFCCSQRHAVFSRDWLRSHGVRANAVFAGPGSDSRGESLRALASRDLDAICVVDLYNEGLDLPEVDRVLMLRPAESKIVFLSNLAADCGQRRASPVLLSSISSVTTAFSPAGLFTSSRCAAMIPPGRG